MNARFSRLFLSVVLMIVLALAIAVPTSAGKPDRWHAQFEGGHTIYCDSEDDADMVWDYILDGRFWEEYQNFYFYDKAGNLSQIKTNWLWNGKLTERATGTVFTDKWAESDKYTPLDWSTFVQTSTGNWQTTHNPGSPTDPSYHAAGRLILKWEVVDPYNPDTWLFLGVVGQSGRWPEAPAADVCDYFKDGHVVEMEALPIVVKQLQ